MSEYSHVSLSVSDIVPDEDDPCTPLHHLRAFALLLIEPDLVGACTTAGHNFVASFHVHSTGSGHGREAHAAHAAGVERLAGMAALDGMWFHVVAHRADDTPSVTISHQDDPSREDAERIRVAMATRAGLDASVPGWRGMRWADGTPKYAPDGTPVAGQ